MNDNERFLASLGMTEEREFVISNPKWNEKSFADCETKLSQSMNDNKRFLASLGMTEE